MSTMVNEKSIAFLQTNVARFMLGDLFLELSLELAPKQKEETRKEAAAKAELVVNGERVHLSKLADNALLSYTMKVYSVDYTSHTHEDMRLLNESLHVYDDTMRVESNMTETKLERDSFNGVKLDSAKIRALILLMYKHAQSQKSSQAWTKQSGIFKLNKGKDAKGKIQWIPYAPTKPKTVTKTAIETNQPLLDLGEIASAIVNTQAPMQAIDSTVMHQTAKKETANKRKNKRITIE